MPQFDKQFYSDTVPENIELHSPLNVLIQATSPMSRKLIYSIVKGNELEEFAVDFNTGKKISSHFYFFSSSYILLNNFPPLLFPSLCDYCQCRCRLNHFNFSSLSFSLFYIASSFFIPTFVYYFNITMIF